jgi:Flp pilus assembly protein TadG
MISVLLLMMFGVVGFGTALYTYHFVSNTAREATRWASVRGSTCPLNLPSLPDGCPAADSDVNAYVQNLSTGIGLDPTKVTTTTTWVAPPNNLAACTAQANSPGCVVKVQVQYSFQFLFPLLPSGFTMQSTSQMVISQ